jgi:hypothetical protein
MYRLSEFINLKQSTGYSFIPGDLVQIVKGPANLGELWVIESQTKSPTDLNDPSKFKPTYIAVSGSRHYEIRDESWIQRFGPRCPELLPDWPGWEKWHEEHKIG